MVTPRCPNCGHPLDTSIPSNLTHYEALVFECVRDRPGATIQTIYNWVYSKDPRAKPRRGFDAIYVFINKINKKLVGRRIARHGVGYKLSPKEDRNDPLQLPPSVHPGA